MKLLRRFTILSALALFVIVFLTITIRTLAAASTSDIHPPNSNLKNNGGTDHWRILPDMSHGRGDPGVVAYDNKIYALSGFWIPGNGYVDSVEIYDPLANEWEVRWGVPFARSDLMSAVISDSIYLIGGWQKEIGVFGVNNRYDPLTDSWITMTSMITPVSGAGAATVNSDIYILGGFDGISSTSSVQIYHSDSDSWTLVTPMDAELAEFGAVYLDNKIYAVGGVTRNGSVTDTIRVYDLGLKTWSDVTPLPEPRASVAVVVQSGKIHVIGGTDD